MGRPAIGKFTAVRLSEETLARIDALAAAGKRAEFIRDAVAAELDRREAAAEAVRRNDPATLYAALQAQKRITGKP